MSTGIDGKVIVNTLYHSGTVTLLTLGYSELFKNLFRIRAAKADFNMTDFMVLTMDILLAMATRDLLVKEGILPVDILK